MNGHDGENGSMTSPTMMTREELLELAALDAFGLLDEIEAELYTRSFHNAPAAVQDELVHLQAELASDPTLLSPEDPDPSLRDRVLEAVHRAIEQETTALAPIAQIGRRRPRAADVAGFIGLGAAGQFWRAATFTLAAMVVVVIYFWADARDTANNIAELALSNGTSEQLNEWLGRDLEYFLVDAKSTRRVLNTTDAAGFVANGMLLITEPDANGEGQAFVVTIGLPESESLYTLRVVHEDGTVEDLRKFSSNARGTSGIRLDGISVAMLSTLTIEIADVTGAVLMRT